MKAEQLHFTSCRQGRSGHAGFQVRAASPGLPAHEQQEIERRAGYRPPRDLPAQPTPGQIAEEFPVALRYAALPNDRSLLLRAAYCGRDYSNRWGNFFTHALAFDSTGLAGAWPVDHADWPGWRGCLGPDEDREGGASNLATAELPPPRSDGSFGWDELRDFLAESPERPQRLAEMGRAVLLAEEDSRRLVVRDLRTACWYWVACVTKLFPPRHARRLSFSTYEDDPRGAARINATCGETDFTFDETQRRFQFYAFDLVGGSCSEVPASSDDYPAVAASWLAREPRRLQEFFAFMDLFDHAEPTAELRSALWLFQVSKGAALPEGDDLQAMIRFAVSYATEEGRRRIVDQVARAVAPVRRTLQGEERQALLRFFADTAAATGREEHREAANELWLGSVDAVLDGQIEPAVAEAGEELLRKRLGTHGRERAEFFLSTFSPRAASGWRLDGGLFLLRTTGRMLEVLGRRPIWQQEEVVALAHPLLAAGGEVAPRLVPLLELAREEPEGIAVFCRLAVEAGIDAEHAGRALAGFLAGRPPRLALEVRRRLDRRETWPVLFGEWLQICDDSGQPAAAYRRYRRAVVDELPGYGQEYGAVVTSSILGALPDEDRLPLVREWLESGELEAFPDELAARCLDVANAAVDLLAAGAEADRWSRRVAAAAAARGIDLRPDRPGLRKRLRRLREGRGIGGRHAAGGEDVFDPAALRDSLAALDVQEYGDVVQAVLPEALSRVSDPSSHRRLLLAFHRPGEDRPLTKAYRSFLSSQRRREWSASLAAALGFYLEFDPAGAEFKPLAGLERSLRTRLVRALRHLHGDTFARVCREQRKAGSSSREVTRWKELETTVRRRRRGVVTRLKDLFSWTRGQGGTHV